MAGTEGLAAAIRDAEEVKAEIAFKHRRQIAYWRIKSGGLEFRDKLPTSHIFVASTLVFAARIFRVARGSECEAHFSR